MSKVSELSMLVDELKKCGETLVRISEELADLFSSGKDAMQPVKKTAVKKKTNEEPKAEVPEEKALTLKMSEPCVRINPAKAIRQKSKQSLQIMVQKSCP